MRLDPRERDNWQGFLDLMRPPPGFSLVAAFGTTFGLSFEALTAALLALVNADGERIAADPVASVVAITRLKSRVCVALHPGTIYGSARALPPHLIGMLDRFVREICPPAGLFHPKVWVLRFAPIGSAAVDGPAGEGHRGRILVCSRNLSDSKAFELGVAVEGSPAARGTRRSPFAVDVAAAISEWIEAVDPPPGSEVRNLPAFLRTLALDAPSGEARESLRLRWQGLTCPSMRPDLLGTWDRAVAVSPFLTDDCVLALLSSAKELRIVSTREALDALDDATHARLAARSASQGSASLFHVTEVRDGREEEDEVSSESRGAHDELSDTDGVRIEGLHAKLLLAKRGREEVTFVGSANATGPGFGLVSTPNVEAMAELRPGIGIDAFLRGFVFGDSDGEHPWIRPYERPESLEPDEAEEIERSFDRVFHGVGRLELLLDYDEAASRLKCSSSSPAAVLEGSAEREGVRLEIAPLARASDVAAFHPLAALGRGPISFDDIPLEEVTGFVVVRAVHAASAREKSRILLARIRASDGLLDRRDDRARSRLLEYADPAAILRALLEGLRFLPSSGPSRDGGHRRGSRTLQNLLVDTSLERLLEAAAEDPTIVADMRRLIGEHGDESFRLFCDALEGAAGAIDAEFRS